MINLKNLNIILTGGTGVIGNAIIDKLISAGAHVIATGTNEEKLGKLKNDFKGIIFKKFDISKHNEIEKFVDQRGIFYRNFCNL